MMRSLLGVLLAACLPLGSAAPAWAWAGVKSAAPALGAAGSVPQAVAMAWTSVVRDAFARLDMKGLAPGLAGPLSALRRTDFTDPVQLRVLEPLVYSLAAQPSDPAAFSRLPPARQGEFLGAAFAQASLELGAQAARLLMGDAGQDLSSEGLSGTMAQAEGLLLRSVYLTAGQQDALRRMRDDAAAQLDTKRQRRALELAAETARRLSGERAAVPDAETGPPFDPADWTVVRAVMTPEGRRAWFVRQGPIYRVYLAGDPAPAVEFDARRWDQDGIPVYTVERGGRRGIHMDGRVLWEPG
jgi:hypothetical protein